MNKIRIILNGKKAILEEVRTAIFAARAFGDVEVRVTFEGGDAARFVQEAINDGCQRIVAAGGDGTINELVNALMKIEAPNKPELAVMPLGTANDFATGCKIPEDHLSALKLALTGNSYAVDSVRAGEDYFINIASCGFGAQVTSNTPVALKNFLGGGAYTLSGLVQALNFTPYHGNFEIENHKASANMIVGAVCNGRQAGGGQQLAPNSFIDDGLIDFVAVREFPASDLRQVIKEMTDASISGQYVKRRQAESAYWHSQSPIPINLDGEPISVNEIKFEVCPKTINLVVPDHCPMLIKNK